jgi:hypothetical protein
MGNMVSILRDRAQKTCSSQMAAHFGVHDSKPVGIIPILYSRKIKDHLSILNTVFVYDVMGVIFPLCTQQWQGK